VSEQGWVPPTAARLGEAGPPSHHRSAQQAVLHGLHDLHGEKLFVPLLPVK